MKKRAIFLKSSIIGLISEKASLSKGLSLLIVMTLLAAFAGWRNKFLVNKENEITAGEFDEQIIEEVKYQH